MENSSLQRSPEAYDDQQQRDGAGPLLPMGPLPPVAWREREEWTPGSGFAPHYGAQWGFPYPPLPLAPQWATAYPQQSWDYPRSLPMAGAFEQITHQSAYEAVELCYYSQCSQLGTVWMNGGMVCTKHFAHASRRKYANPHNIPCVFPDCNLLGVVFFGADFYCSSHFKNVVKRRPCFHSPECTNPGVIDHNGDQYCKAHIKTILEENSSLRCAFPACSKPGTITFEDNLYCKRHHKTVVEPNLYVHRKAPGDDADKGRICNFVRCNKKKRITLKYRGMFCEKHLSVIEEIRSQIMSAKLANDEHTQISLRYSEIFLRKFLDEGHIRYYQELVRKHGQSS